MKFSGEASVNKHPLPPRVALTQRSTAPVPWDGPLVAQSVIVLRNLRHDAKRRSRSSALMSAPGCKLLGCRREIGSDKCCGVIGACLLLAASVPRNVASSVPAPHFPLEGLDRRKDMSQTRHQCSSSFLSLAVF